jgi:hypothetical protein
MAKCIFIKNNIVSNIIIVDNVDQTFLDDLKSAYNLDEVVTYADSSLDWVTFDSSYENGEFKLPKLNKGWNWDSENNCWTPPTPNPTQPEIRYTWNNDTELWELVVEDEETI